MLAEPPKCLKAYGETLFSAAKLCKMRKKAKVNMLKIVRGG